MQKGGAQSFKRLRAPSLSAEWCDFIVKIVLYLFL